MNIQDLYARLEMLKGAVEVLLKDDEGQKKRFVVGDSGNREQVVAPAIPAEIKDKPAAVQAAAMESKGFKANPNQLTPVDPQQVRHISPKPTPAYDKTLASRSSVPASERNKGAPAKPTFEQRPTGHIHSSGIWDMLEPEYRGHLMETMKPADRDILNSILASMSRKGHSKGEIAEFTRGAIMGKVKKMQESKEFRANQNKKHVSQGDIDAAVAAGLKQREKQQSVGSDISTVPLDKILEHKDWYRDQMGKGEEWYHKAFSADGKYARRQTIKAMRDWILGKPLPKEVTESAEFKRHNLPESGAVAPTQSSGGELQDNTSDDTSGPRRKIISGPAVKPTR